MKRVVLLVALVACKGKDVPFKPPPPEDASARPIDATEVDAAVAAVAAKPTKIVVGDYTSCAILADATLRCWGKNGDGQLSKDEVPERLHGMFERGDTNKDGVLGKDELRKLAEAQSGARRDEREERSEDERRPTRPPFNQ